MATRSIGTLAAFITADSTQFMKEFNKLDRQLARSSKSWTEPGAKLAMGFLGVENAAKAVVREIKDVIQNVEKIQGIDPQALDSIITLRKNISDAKNWVDRTAASIVGFGVRAAQAVGVGAAMIYNRLTGTEDDFSGLAKLESPDEIARSKDAGFDDKVTEARKRLAEAHKAAALAAVDEATKIKMLREESTRLETFSKSSSITTVERLDAQTKAFEKTADANARLQAMKEKLAETEKKSGELFGDVIAARSIKTPDVKLSDLDTRLMSLNRQIAQQNVFGDLNDPATIKALTDLENQRSLIYQRMIPLLEKQKQLAIEVGNAFGSAVEDAIMSGKKFADVLRSLGDELVRLFLREQLIQPISKGVSAMFSGLFGGVSAGTATAIPAPGRAVGGPVGGGSLYTVGEKGPELFVPDSAGRIIPNASLRGGSGGQAVIVNQTNHFSSGVTRQELSAILPEIQRVTVASVMEKVQRGGTYRKAFV